MVSVVQRMWKLKALLAIRLGPGAAQLPPDVKRIHMDFAYKINDGHFGPRKFWRLYLPRLKYHNPAVSMTLNRTTNQEGPATMTIYFAPPPSSTTSTTTPTKPIPKSPSPTPAPTTSTSTDTAPSDHTPFTRTQTINMKHRHESEILSQLLEATKAVEIKATKEEEQEIREMEEEGERREADSRRSGLVNAQRKRSEEMLKQARGQVLEG